MSFSISLCSLFILHGSPTAVKKVVFVVDQLLELPKVVLGPIFQLDALGSELLVHAIELPHAAMQNSLYLLNLGHG